MKVKTLSEFLKNFPTVSRSKFFKFLSFSLISSLSLTLSLSLIVSVKWGDMDAFKHVNNTMYFRYQEVSRGIFLQNILKKIPFNSNFNHKEWNEGSGIGPILSTTSCIFKFPLSYPDNLLIGSTIKSGDIFSDRVKVTHSIWSLKHQRIASEGSGVIVTYDFVTGKVVDIPEILKTAMEEHLKEDSLHLLSTYENLTDFQSEF